MPEELKILTYKFSELSPDAQKTAIAWMQKCNLEDNFSCEMLTEDFKELLKEAGFYDDVKCYWSLNSCQGDGVAFEGRMDPEKLRAVADFKEIFDELEKVGVDVIQTHIKVTHSGHYCHWNSMDVEVESYYSVDATDEQMSEIECKHKLELELEAAIDSYCKKLSRKLEKDGYSYLDWYHGEEKAREDLEANDYLFTASGKRSITL